MVVFQDTHELPILILYFQDHFPNSKIVIFDCFRNNDTFENGNLKSFGHYKNLIGFKGSVICGNLNDDQDLKLLSSFEFTGKSFFIIKKILERKKLLRKK